MQTIMTQPELIRKIVVDEIEKITGKPGEGVTRDYLFHRDYASHRAHGTVHTPESRSVLQFLFETINEEERARLFPGIFDLGNLKIQGPATTRALMDEFEKEGRPDPTNFMRNARERQIAKLTGYPFNAYLDGDALKSLKVLKLLWLLNRGFSGQMFSYLTAPDSADEASLEVSRTYPMEVNAARSALLSDLATHLTLEMHQERRDDINKLFVNLRDMLDQVDAGFIGLAGTYSQGDPKKLEKLLALAIKMLDDYQPGNPVPAKPLFMPLDETLFVHCSGLEFLHFAKIYEQVVTVTTPTIEVHPLNGKLGCIEAAINAKMFRPSANPRIPLPAFEGFAREHTDAFIDLLKEGMGHEIQRKVFDEAIPRAYRLLSSWAAFNPRIGLGALLTGKAKIQPLEAAAALAAVCHQKINPTSYRPYWKGQQHDRGNVLSALDRIDPWHPKTTVEEEYFRFWDHQMKHFAHGFWGVPTLYRHKLTITQRLISAIEPAVRMRDTVLVRQRLAEYAQLTAKAAHMFAHSGI